MNASAATDTGNAWTDCSSTNKSQTDLCIPAAAPGPGEEPDRFTVDSRCLTPGRFRHLTVIKIYCSLAPQVRARMTIWVTFLFAGNMSGRREPRSFQAELDRHE